MSGASGCARATASIAVAFFSLVACGDGNEEEGAIREGEQSEAFCEAECTRNSECGGVAPVKDCEQGCLAQVHLEDLRPEGVKIVADCILKLPCSHFYDENAFSACWDRAEREVEPTEATRRFCLAWSTRWFECGGGYSTVECEADWALSSNDYLSRMSACLDVDCESLPTCAEAVQGGS